MSYLVSTGFLVRPAVTQSTQKCSSVDPPTRLLSMPSYVRARPRRGGGLRSRLMSTAVLGATKWQSRRTFRVGLTGLILSLPEGCHSSVPPRNLAHIRTPTNRIRTSVQHGLSSQDPSHSHMFRFIHARTSPPGPDIHTLVRQRSLRSRHTTYDQLINCPCVYRGSPATQPYAYIHVTVGRGRKEIDFVSAKPKCAKTEQHPVICILPAGPSCKPALPDEPMHSCWAKDRGQCGGGLCWCRRCPRASCEVRAPIPFCAPEPCGHANSSGGVTDEQGWKIRYRVRLPPMIVHVATNLIRSRGLSNAEVQNDVDNSIEEFRQSGTL
ncbi:hypothetical protein F5883DRAFT_166248 [Diaporthe sp. PMI_573]|nr:hypothetical protein F5883DRAFT_166248 [Diaporthaceae sp. PMI_573]